MRKPPKPSPASDPSLIPARDPAAPERTGPPGRCRRGQGQSPPPAAAPEDPSVSRTEDHRHQGGGHSGQRARRSRRCRPTGRDRAPTMPTADGQPGSRGPRQGLIERNGLADDQREPDEHASPRRRWRRAPSTWKESLFVAARPPQKSPLPQTHAEQSARTTPRVISARYDLDVRQRHRRLRR